MLTLVSFCLLVIGTRVVSVDAVQCYTCQYSDNPTFVGFACVDSPADYILGPPTGTCSTPCQTLRQVSVATGSVYYVWRGCQPENSPSDGCISDIFYENCRQTCDGELCNGADLSVATTPAPSTLPVPTTSPLSTTTVVYAYQCYTCQYSDNPTAVGLECVNSPADYILGPPTGGCNTPCHTLRQVSLDTGVVFYVWRGCRPEASPADGCTSDTFYESCRQTCDTDLCNGADLSVVTTIPPSTLPVPTTSPPTTTTEIPGTRWCYSCVYSYNPDANDACVFDAPNAPPPNQVRCPPSRVCTTFRQWDKGNAVVRSFARGCEEQLGRVDGCLEDTFFITCQTYCSGEYCNSGSGIP